MVAQVPREAAKREEEQEASGTKAIHVKAIHARMHPGRPTTP